jgi:hypothetical protein
MAIAGAFFYFLFFIFVCSLPVEALLDSWAFRRCPREAPAHLN